MMVMKKYLSIVLVLFVGCSTAQSDAILSVTNNYEKVVFDDGISLEEAKMVAQKQLVKNNVVDLYDLSRPQIDEDVAELPGHENYWFVFFEEKQPASIPFIFMVLVDKETGKVKYADDHNEGNQWILEAALLH